MDLADEKEGFERQININIRAVAAETKKFSLTMRRNVNDKIMDIAKELADFMEEDKYGLSFYY